MAWHSRGAQRCCVNGAFVRIVMCASETHIHSSLLLRTRTQTNTCHTQTHRRTHNYPSAGRCPNASCPPASLPLSVCALSLPSPV